MEFKLYYEGVLKSNSNAKNKHCLRIHFHKQLKQLWNYLPLKDRDDWFNISHKNGNSLIEIYNDFSFVPLVTSKLHLFAELDILFLQKNILGQYGDIDNKLKTLLDGLRCPKNISEIDSSWTPTDNEKPLICLLEDDSLISKININVERLLKPDLGKNSLFLLITVKIRGVFGNFGNLDLIV